MPQQRMHVLERESQPVRGAGRVAPLLRREMEARNVSAKELALLLKAWAKSDPAHRWPIDYRTIQHAAAGTACSLDTYLTLSGFFGWDFVEDVQTPIRGADPLTDREAIVARQLAQAAALQARVERERAVRAATMPQNHREVGGQGVSPAHTAREPRAIVRRALSAVGAAAAID